MRKRAILVLLSVLISGHIWSQKRSSIKIRSALIKTIELKDTLKGGSIDYYKCQKWQLTSTEAYKIFSMSEPISSEQAQDLYYWLPCYFTAKVSYEGLIYTMEINAASFIVLYNDKCTLYFGCSSDSCKVYFILPGGNASED